MRETKLSWYVGLDTEGTRIGDALKSKSGPLDSGQLVLSWRRHADTYASAGDI
mgnify:CR=1 FL=1